MKLARFSVYTIATLSTSVALALAGCSGSATSSPAARGGDSTPTQTENSSGVTDTEPAEESARPEADGSADITCEQVAELVAPMTDGMELLTDLGGGNEGLFCQFGPPGANPNRGSDLDFIVNIQAGWFVPDKVQTYCDEKRVVASQLDSIGGCIELVDVAVEGARAATRQAAIYIGYSCEMSTLCRPTIPAGVDDAVAIRALERVGLALADN